ncbi:MAG: hypothetical protein ABIV94_02255 [Acidimicrobiales bacterium]
MGSLPIVFAGCGSSAPTPSGDAREIETLIVRHYAHPSCADLTTLGRTAFGHPADDGACAEDIASQAPKDVTVSDIEVKGDHGSAVADGFSFRVLMVDGAWLIDGGA